MRVHNSVHTIYKPINYVYRIYMQVLLHNIMLDQLPLPPNQKKNPV